MRVCNFLLVVAVRAYVPPQRLSIHVETHLRELEKVDFFDRWKLAPSRPVVVESIVPLTALTDPSPGVVDIVRYDLHLVRLTHPFISKHREGCAFGNYYDGFLEKDSVVEIDAVTQKLKTFHAWKMTTCSKCATKKHFYPPVDESRGEIARACAHFFASHPEHRRDMPAIISTRLLRAWHDKYPATPREMCRNRAIREIQGNSNEFTTRPDLVEEYFGNA